MEPLTKEAQTEPTESEEEILGSNTENVQSMCLSTPPYNSIEGESAEKMIEDVSTEEAPTTTAGFETETPEIPSEVEQVNGLELLSIVASTRTHIRFHGHQYLKERLHFVDRINIPKISTPLQDSEIEWGDIVNTIEVSTENTPVEKLKNECGDFSKIVAAFATKLENECSDIVESVGVLTKNKISKKLENECRDFLEVSPKSESVNKQGNEESNDIVIAKLSEIHSYAKKVELLCENSSETIKVSPENASFKQQENDCMQQYASRYSKELLFAVDVMNLLRHLNNLPCRLIMYGTTGISPRSPCTDLMDDALILLWLEIKEDIDVQFEWQVETTIMNYSLFQKILQSAEYFDNREYLEKAFLRYCVSIAYCAVRAEISGVTEAPEFIPLVICRTIQKFQDSGKIPKNFWERIAEKAFDIIVALDD